MVILLAFTSLAPICAQMAADLLSEDGRFAAAVVFRGRYELPSMKSLGQDAVWFMAGRNRAMTESQIGNEANKKRNVARLSPLADGATAWDKSTWCICMVNRPLKPGAPFAYWVTRIHADRRGPNPNEGVNLPADIMQNVVQIVGQDVVTITGMRRPISARPETPVVVSYSVNIASRTFKRRWERMEKNMMLYDSSGVLTLSGGVWSFIDGANGRSKLLPRTEKPLGVRAFRIYYNMPTGLQVLNLKTDSWQTFEGFSAQVISGSGNKVLGIKQGRTQVVSIR